MITLACLYASNDWAKTRALIGDEGNTYIFLFCLINDFEISRY